MPDIIHISSNLPAGNSGSIPDLIEAFLSDQQIDPKSRRTYKTSLKKYFDWMAGQHLQLKDITRTDIIRFNQHLIDEKYSILTANGYLVAIRSFYEWTEGIKLYPNVAKGIKPNKVSSDHRKESLTEEQAAKLLEYMQTRPARDRAIVALIVSGAFRAIEITRIRFCDIKQKAGKRVVEVWGKGRKEYDEDVVIIDEVWQLIQEYISERTIKSMEEHLFVGESNNSNGAITTRTVSGICKQALRDIGLDSEMYTCHSLRHTTAVLLLLKGVPLYEVQQTLRHKSPETTMIYLESIRKRKRIEDASVEKLSGLFSEKSGGDGAR